MNLPAALEAVQQPIGVPATLVERSEHIRTQGGLAKLETMMKDVRRVATVNRRLVEEVGLPFCRFTVPVSGRVGPWALIEMSKLAHRVTNCSHTKPTSTRPTARRTAPAAGLAIPQQKFLLPSRNEPTSSRRS